jgi:hypothetical protein
MTRPTVPEAGPQPVERHNQSCVTATALESGHHRCQCLCHDALERAANEGRNVLPDATDDQAAVIEQWAASVTTPSSPRAGEAPRIEVPRCRYVCGLSERVHDDARTNHPFMGAGPRAGEAEGGVRPTLDYRVLNHFPFVRDRVLGCDCGWQTDGTGHKDEWWSHIFRDMAALASPEPDEEARP